MFKNTKIQKHKENLYIKKKINRLLFESAFVVFCFFKLRHLTYLEYSIDNLYSVYLSRKILNQKDGEKERKKEKEKV